MGGLTIKNCWIDGNGAAAIGVAVSVVVGVGVGVASISAGIVGTAAVGSVGAGRSEMS